MSPRSRQASLRIESFATAAPAGGRRGPKAFVCNSLVIADVEHVVVGLWAVCPSVLVGGSSQRFSLSLSLVCQYCLPHGVAFRSVDRILRGLKLITFLGIFIRTVRFKRLTFFPYKKVGNWNFTHSP